MQKFLIALFAVLLAACTPNPPAKEERMSTNKWEKMDIVLTTETYPPLPEEADTLYRYALWHDINTRRKPSTRHKLLPYLRYYRIAAANGHWQANKTLQHILMYNEDVDIPDRRRAAQALGFERQVLPLFRRQNPPLPQREGRGTSQHHSNCDPTQCGRRHVLRPAVT